MQLAIILSTEETEKVAQGDQGFIAEVKRVAASLGPGADILGRDDAREPLYSIDLP